MSRWFSLLLLLLSLHAGVADAGGGAEDCAQLSAADAALAQSLLRADRTLAADAQSAASTAFVATLAEDSVLFMPEIQPAIRWWSRQVPERSPVQWSPQAVGVSADGSLGYSYGPYWRTAALIKPALGTYLAIWMRQGDRWQLLLDHGVDGPAKASPATVSRCLSGGAAVATDDRIGRFESLRRAEEQLAKATFGADSWLLETGRATAVGKRRCALPLQRLRIAGSADLGYTAGAQGTRSFVRIWRYSADSGWQVEVELCSTAKQPVIAP